MQMLKRNISSAAVCIFEAVVGVLLLINPVGFTSGIIIACGIAMMFTGIISIVKYFRMDAREAASGQLLLKGLLALLVGAFCTFKSQWFVVTFPLLTMLYGIVILVIGIGKIQWTVDMVRLKCGKWQIMALSAVISLVCAIVILTRPFSTTAVLWMFMGASMLVGAVFDLLAVFANKQKNEK